MKGPEKLFEKAATPAAQSAAQAARRSRRAVGGVGEDGEGGTGMGMTGARDPCGRALAGKGRRRQECSTLTAVGRHPR